MNCPNCNHPLGENSKFCTECGAKISSEPTSSETESNTNFTDSNAQPEESTKTAIKTDEKKQKKKKVKKILLIIALSALSVFIIYTLLYIINPGCMFRHTESQHIIINATCSQEGSEKYVCADCGDIMSEWKIDKLDHAWDNVSCDIEHTCLTCGTKEKLNHSANSDGVCRYCGKGKLSVTIKRNLNDPFIYEYDYKGNLSSAVSISDPIVTTYSTSVGIDYTMTKIYDQYGDYSSSYGCIGWKLYNSKGVIVKSGTDYSGGQIKVGETSECLIFIDYLDPWEQYTLEIINVS